MFLITTFCHCFRKPDTGYSSGSEDRKEGIFEKDLGSRGAAGSIRNCSEGYLGKGRPFTAG